MKLVCLALMCLFMAGPVAVAVADDAAVAEDRVSPEHMEGGAHHGDPNPLTMDPDLALWTVVVFVALLAILSQFAWPQISAALLAREKNIEDNIASAAAMNAEAKQLLAQHEAKLATAADEVRALLEEARRDAEQTKTQIVAEAKKAADAERDRAVRDVERAADHAMQDIAEKIANQSVKLAGMIVQQNITPDQQSKLVRDALNMIASTEPSKN